MSPSGFWGLELREKPVQVAPAGGKQPRPGAIFSGGSRKGVLNMTIKYFRVKAFVMGALFCAAVAACAGSPPPVSAQSIPPANELHTASAQPAVPPANEMEVAFTPSVAPEDDLDAAIRETSDYLNRQLPRGNKLVILNVQSEFPALSEYIIDELIANTVNDRIFSVVDRQQLNTIRAELEFQTSGEVDDDTAQALGRMAGAQIIVSGAVSRLGDLYRLRVRALSVQTAQIEGQFNRNITEGSTIAALVRSRATGYGGESQGGAARNTSPAVPASAAVPAMPPASPSADYQIGQRGPAGGFVFYDNNPPPVSQAAPTTQTYTVGQNGPAGGLTFYDNEPRVIQVVAPVNSSVVYKVGDRGPAGGTIFYVNPSATDGWRYLEAAPASTEWTGIAWSTLSRASDLKGTNIDMGTGKQNTQVIVNYSLNNGVSCRAAMVCNNLTSGGYDDWFLPSKSELNLMFVYLREAGIGGFKGDWYWSSSVNDNGYVWVQQFNDGSQGDAYPFGGENRSEHLVRAIRQF
jgi:curli biogenesis system outer membrane secretion channel CsgG